MKSAAYWAQRAESRQQGYEKDSQQTLRLLKKAHQEASLSIQEDIDRILARYMKSYKLSRVEALHLLSEPVGREEYERLLLRIESEKLPKAQRKKLHAVASSGAYAYRINSLELLSDNIRVSIYKLADIKVLAVSAGLSAIAKRAHSKAMFDIQQGVGIGFSFQALNERVITQILKNPWSGKTFSERIWQDADKLAELLNEKLTAGLMTGSSVKQITSEFMPYVLLSEEELKLTVGEQMAISYRRAERLVRTELNYVSGQVELESYRESGIKRYQFLATLDNRTSQICIELDGKTFLVAQAAPGKNHPPMHPNCRSGSTPVIDSKAIAHMTRLAKNPETGERYKVPASMTYTQWRKTFEET